MAVLQNQASLTYTGGTVLSNLAVGELVDSLSMTKTALQSTYNRNYPVPYLISITNTSDAALTGLTLTDNLGQYSAAGGDVYPLTFVPGTLSMVVNGVVQTTGLPAVVPGPPLSLTGINVPANSNVILLYMADPNAYAPLGRTGTVTNLATLSGPGVAPALTDAETVSFAQVPDLEVVKSINPVSVQTGETVTYTMRINNYGPIAAGPDQNIALSDRLDPPLRNITVTLDGAPLSAANYTYDQNTGLFTTNPGVITVDAAEYAVAPTGETSTDPGTVVLAISGTI